MVVGHDGRAVVAAAVAGRDDLRVEVRLEQLDVVDQHDAVAHLDRLALEGDDPLDQVTLRRPIDLVEDDDVPTIRIVEPVGELVDEHPVAVVKGEVHRVAIDHEVGEHECAHEEGDEQRHADDDDPVDETAGSTARLARPGLDLNIVWVELVGVVDDQFGGLGECVGAARMEVFGHFFR